MTVIFILVYTVFWSLVMQVYEPVGFIFFCFNFCQVNIVNPITQVKAQLSLNRAGWVMCQWESKEIYGTEFISKTSLFWPGSIYSCSVFLRSGENSEPTVFSLSVSARIWSPTLVVVTVTLASPPLLAFTPHPSPHLPWASIGDLGLSRVCERLQSTEEVEEC